MTSTQSTASGNVSCTNGSLVVEKAAMLVIQRPAFGWLGCLYLPTVKTTAQIEQGGSFGPTNFRNERMGSYLSISQLVTKVMNR
jgi:hypothetical protein